MPFKSQAQRGKFYAMADRGEISDATVKKWEKETPKGKKLPRKVSKKSAHDLGFTLGIHISNNSLEDKLIALHKAASASPELLPLLAAHAGEWVLRAEQQYPGFAKFAGEFMEKSAAPQGVILPTRGLEGTTTPTPAPAPTVTPAQQAARFAQLKGVAGGKSAVPGWMGKAYGFLRGNKWVLPLAMAALGGGLGGWGGALAGGLGGYFGQRYLPQMAAYGMRQFGGMGDAYNQDQLSKIMSNPNWNQALTQSLGGSVRNFGQIGELGKAYMGRPGMQNLGRAAKGTGQALGQTASTMFPGVSGLMNQFKGLFGAKPQTMAGLR